MIAIVDYGVGNLFSLQSSFAAIGAEAVVTGDARAIRAAERVVLPGVGAFHDAAAKLRESGLGALVVEQARAGKPLLGICLGMQLLMEESLEFGRWRGLGLVPGAARPIAGVIPAGLKVPQMGWNALRFPRSSPIFRDTREGEHVYFVHSYYCDAPAQCVSALTDYGAPIVAAVQRDNVYGCQFHPEKSGPAGLRILRAFSETEAKR